jgi:hypothetical protein
MLFRRPFRVGPPPDCARLFGGLWGVGGRVGGGGGMGRCQAGHAGQGPSCGPTAIVRGDGVRGKCVAHPTSYPYLMPHTSYSLIIVAEEGRTCGFYATFAGLITIHDQYW